MPHRMSAIVLWTFLAAIASFPSGGTASPKTPDHKSEESKSSGGKAAVEQGRVLFNARCEICHFSGSFASKIGPGLAGIYKRGKFANGAAANDASIEKLILNGGKNMPPFKGTLNPTQIHDLITYLKTL